MRRATKVALAVAAVAILAVAGAAAWWLFAPKPATHLAEAPPEGAVVVKRGAWRDGETFHRASGEVAIVRLPDGSQATARGDFTVPLPAGFDPAAYARVVAWCNSYDVRFGSAALA